MKKRICGLVSIFLTLALVLNCMTFTFGVMDDEEYSKLSGYPKFFYVNFVSIDDDDSTEDGISTEISEVGSSFVFIDKPQLAIEGESDGILMKDALLDATYTDNSGVEPVEKKIVSEHYTITGFNIWEVTESGSITNSASSGINATKHSSDELDMATLTAGESTFREYVGADTSYGVVIFYPVVEVLAKAIEYPVMVYDADGTNYQEIAGINFSYTFTADEQIEYDEVALPDSASLGVDSTIVNWYLCFEDNTAIDLGINDSKLLSEVKSIFFEYVDNFGANPTKASLRFVSPLELEADSSTLYSVSGNLNDDTGWYNSDVTITPVEGYSISVDMVNFSDKLTISSSVAEGYSFYLKNSEGKVAAVKYSNPINIDKKVPTVTGAMEGGIYDNAVKEVTVSDENLYSYRKNDETEVIVGINDNGNSTVTVEYSPSIKMATLAATDLAGNSTDLSFYVRPQAIATVGVSGTSYGQTLTPIPTLSFSSGESAELLDSSINSTPAYTYKVKGAADSTYTATVPTAVGDYTVKATYADTNAYIGTTATADFSITYATSPTPPYTVSGTEGNNGWYISKVVLTPATGYEVSEDGRNFKESITISEATSKEIYLRQISTGATTDAIEVDSIKIDTVAPTVLGISDGATYDETKTVTISDDNLASVLINGEALTITNGSATAEIVGAAKDQVIVATDEAGHSVTVTIIVRIDGSAIVDISDYYVGATPSNPTSSTTTNVDKNGVVFVPTYTYKLQGNADSTYTATAPTTRGNYTVRASFPASKYYKEAFATKDFVISYLEAPQSPVTPTGTEAAEGWYTSDVTFTPRIGYIVSTDGVTFKDSVTITESQELKLYLQEVSTGATTDLLSVGTYRIDKLAPVVTGIENGKTYSGTTSVTVTDENLSTVSINGAEVTVTDGKAIFVLEPSVAPYTIIARDEAGHAITYTVNVEAEKITSISGSGKYQLQVGEKYSFDEGKWTITGDPTIYEGGNSFYIRKEGEYEFTQK